MSYKEILELIETVDPNDTAKLDEVDARVWCWLNSEKYLGTIKNNKGYIVTNAFEFKHDIPVSANSVSEKYTRSRDALKAIRPEGWYFEISYWANRLAIGSGFIGYINQPEFKCVRSPELPNEELAELHAIVQAIAYERGEK